MKRFILIIGCLALAACNTPVATETIIVEPTSTEPVLNTPEPTATTPTFIPTEAATATSAPPPLYFTDEFDAPSSYWQFFQTGGIDSPLQTSFENGSLRLNTSMSEAWYAGIYTANTYSNVYVSAKVSGTPSGSVGLICRYNEEDGWFEFNIASDGIYSALYGHWLAPGIAEYRPVANTSAGQLQPNALDYELGLSCQDDFMLLLVNGKSVRRLDVSRFELVDGNVGITASSFSETPMTATFDWFKVAETE